MLYKNSWRYNDLWIKFSQFHNLMDLCNGGFCCFGHDRTKIPCCLTVGQVAPLICLIGINQGIISMYRIFQHTILSIDTTRFLALSYLGSDTGWSRSSSYACTGGLNTAGQIALWHQFQLNFSGFIQIFKVGWLIGTWK